MTSKTKLIGSLAAGGAALLASSPLQAQHSPKAPFYFTGKIFKAEIDVER